MTEQSEGERLYILGHPVAHSKSPVMYNALYEKLGLPWTYALADYAELDEARAFLDARDFLSVNITTPYKPLAFQTATRKAASAQLAQGANVLVRKDDQLIGFNTDGDGCVKFLELAGVTFKGKRVVVCGTGPDGPLHPSCVRYRRCRCAVAALARQGARAKRVGCLS